MKLGLFQIKLWVKIIYLNQKNGHPSSFDLDKKSPCFFAERSGLPFRLRNK